MGLDPESTDPVALAKDFLIFQKELGVFSVPRPTTAGPKGPAEGSGEETGSLEAFGDEVRICRLCGLCEGRTNVVFGSGNPDADVMFVGEAPGKEEDLQGLPFVGAAGQLLTQMIGAIGLTREDVYITNVIKCRPPGNRDPRQDEIAQCQPYLLEQIARIRPTIICTARSTPPSPRNSRCRSCSSRCPMNLFETTPGKCPGSPG